METKKEKSVSRKTFEWVFTIAIAILIAVLFRNYVIARADVDGPSMQNTLHDKDVLFVEKISQLSKNIKRGQIVIFDSGNENHDIYIKRVIALGGDKIQIANGKVYLNGSVLKEDYLSLNTVTETGPFLENAGIYTVPKGYIFVMGDNRGNSTDSRILGPIDINKVKGHVILRAYPFKDFRTF